MFLKTTSIQQKLVRVMLLTGGAVLLVTCFIYLAYDYITFRQATINKITMLGKVIATNSTAALAFNSQEEAVEILTALKAEDYMVAAGLYNEEGKLFAQYPSNMHSELFPDVPGTDGYLYSNAHLEGFQPVEEGDRRLGTLYLKYDMRVLFDRLKVFAGLALLMIAVSSLLAYVLSKILQRRISTPILALVETARAVSEDHDYSVRAQKVGEDEIGRLTDAFNFMLTQIKIKNEALSESNERVRAVLDSTHSAVIVVDTTDQVIDWNLQAEKMFEWTRQDILGRDLAETIIVPRDRRIYKQGLAHFLVSGEGSIVHQLVELSALRRSGTEFPVEMSVSSLRIENQHVFCAFITDITDRKNAEEVLKTSKERLENIVQSMGDAYVSMDKYWRYTFVNNKALNLMQKTEEELLGKTLWEVFPDVLGSTFEIEYRKVMNERVSGSFEIYYPSYQMWLEVRAYPHEDGIAIFYTDITKYRKAEEEIRAFNQKLENMVEERTIRLAEANKELEAFSYSVSHDLRAPLRAIHGYMNIFAEDYAEKLDKEANRVMNIIQSNAKRMGQLIDDLLAFSKLSRKELLKGTVSMTELVTSVWDDQVKIEGDRAIELVMDELPEAYVDSPAIRQVWVNLISNAIKYTRQNKEAKVEIHAEENDEGTIYSIKDNGAGFDMQYYNKLFGVFQRLHSQKEFEGTGVGLAIVQRVVAKHGGKVWAEAAPGKGATFYFSIARKQEEE